MIYLLFIFIARLLLNGNQITDVGYNNAFPYLPNLRILHLHNNPITQIHPDAFQNVSHIHTLLLHFTDITTVDNQMLVPLTRLKWFWANNAKLTSIGTNPFQYNPNIIEIYLQYNDLSNITNGIWKNLHDLKHLYLHGNTNLEEPTCCTLCNAAPDVDLKWTGMTPGTEDEMGLTGIRKVKLPCGCEGGTSIVCPGVAELCFVDEICNDYVFSSANSLFGSFRNRLILTITMIIIACFSI